MSMLALAIKAQLPLIHVTTDDLINVEEVLSFISEQKAKPVSIPEVIPKEGIKFPTGKVFFCGTNCKSLVQLYKTAVNEEVTIVFVNTEKSVLMFDGEVMYPPSELVLKFIKEMEVVDDATADDLLVAFGGLTLKDVGEVAKLTMTRDDSLTVRGVNETRRGYAGKLKGIDQVDTNLGFYVCPQELGQWVKENRKFFLHPVHPSLVPRGLLFDGPPGTGKTMAAKAIASAFGVALYRLDLGSMMGKYVGESETNLMSALAQIDQVEPCVILFDEVEKIFQGSSDSGVTSRLLSQLLWWLQEHKTKVFSVMTTNNVGIIPDELHRPGRIDKTMMFLGIETKEEGIQFANGAMETMCKELEFAPSEAQSKKIVQKVSKLFNGGDPVPQVKLTQTVFDSIKEFVAENPDYA